MGGFLDGVLRPRVVGTASGVASGLSRACGGASVTSSHQTRVGSPFCDASTTWAMEVRLVMRGSCIDWGAATKYPNGRLRHWFPPDVGVRSTSLTSQKRCWWHSVADSAERSCVGPRGWPKEGTGPAMHLAEATILCTAQRFTFLPIRALREHTASSGSNSWHGCRAVLFVSAGIRSGRTRVGVLSGCSRRKRAASAFSRSPALFSTI
jgi:hypothetical protein